YTLEVFNIPSEWNGIYNVMTQNETLIFGEFSGEESTFLVNFGLEAEGCDQINEIYGCTDAEAINFNPEATMDDGSCEYDFECGISFEVIADSLGENMFYIIPSGNIVNASSVLWDFGDGSTSTEFYPTHIYESDGPFTLCLFVTFEDNIGNYCEISYCEVLDGTLFGGPGVLSGGFMINVIPTDALSNDSSIAKTEISVYPNPTNDMATISYLSDRSEKLTLRIFDLTGKVLEQQVLSSSIGKQKIQVDLSEFPQGLYLIGLEQNESRTYAKVVRR
ncbi:MAG TPA: T9SS type A sorting domain-containing protein, partial [Cryomorphaceae bacterium]|nr:T9SS type A sorting domain-containing protein [Cryomorphaceae bacterium]